MSLFTSFQPPLCATWLAEDHVTNCDLVHITKYWLPPLDLGRGGTAKKTSFLSWTCHRLDYPLLVNLCSLSGPAYTTNNSLWKKLGCVEWIGSIFNFNLFWNNYKLCNFYSNKVHKDQHGSHLTAHCMYRWCLILANTVCYGCKENWNGETNEELWSRPNKWNLGRKLTL